MLGINDDTVVSEALKNIKNMEDLSGCRMPLGDYAAFFTATHKDPVKAFEFLHQLIDTLIFVEKKAFSNKNRETKVKAKIFDDCVQMALALVHTIHFVAFHLKIDHKSLSVSIKNWDLHRSTIRDIFKFDTNSPIQLVKKLHIQKENNIKSRVKESIADSERWSQSMQTIAGLEDRDFSSMYCAEDFPLIYIQLKKLLLSRENDNQREIFDSLMEWLDKEKKKEYAKGNPELTQKALLSLFFILKEFITAYPIADDLYIQKLISKIQLFYSWPRPYSIACQDLIDLLRTEMRSPGTAMRKRFSEENPFLSNLEELLEKISTDRTMLHNDLVLYSHVQRHVSVFFGSGDSCPESRVYAQMFNSSISEVDEFHAELLVLRRRLLATIFEMDITLNPEGSIDVDEGELKLDSKSNSEIEKWYRQACHVVNDAARIKDEYFKAYRESFLSDIAREIAPSKNVIPVRYNYVGGELSGDTTSTIPKPSDPVCFKECFSRRTIVDLPDVTLNFRTIQQEVSAIGLGSTDSLGEKQRIHYKEEVHPLAVTVEHLAKITKLIHELDDGAGSKKLIERPILKLCCMGDDCTLHRFLCSYVILANNAIFDGGNLLDNLDVRIYTIPTGVNCQNGVSELLAMKDPWYRRQVYAPFKEIQLVPLLSFSEAVDERVEACEGSPLFHQRKLMEEYFRGATNSVNVRVFDCECWVGNESVNVTIPFCFKMEIGINCDVRQHQVQVRSATRKTDGDDKGDVSEMSWDAVLQDKGFNKSKANGFSTPDLKISYRVSSSDSVGKKVDVQAPFGFISVSNAADFTNCKPASSPVLELSYLQNTKKYQELTRKKDKSQKDVDALRETMKNEAEYDDVGTLEVEVVDDDSQFDILLDGKLFGSFTKIRISPSLLKDGTQLTLPLMSFLALD